MGSVQVRQRRVKAFSRKHCRRRKNPLHQGLQQSWALAHEAGQQITGWSTTEYTLASVTRGEYMNVTTHFGTLVGARIRMYETCWDAPSLQIAVSPEDDSQGDNTESKQSTQARGRPAPQ